MTQQSKGTYSTSTLPVKAVHSNLQQEIIQITEDKLTLILKNHISDLEQRKGWIAPLGIFLTILIVLITADFKTGYFEASTWEAFFLMAEVLTCIWLMIAARSAYNTKSTEDIICTIKNSLDVKDSV